MIARRIGEAAIGLVPIVFILALWQALAVTGAAPAEILPPPTAVFARLLQQIGTSQYWDNFAITLFRLFSGFSIALVTGVTLGVAATGSRIVEALEARRARARTTAEGRALSGADPD